VADDASPEETAGAGALPPHRGLAAFQRHIEALYGERDAARGLASTFMWFTEEVGELARAVRGGDPDNLRTEVGDVLAWLATVASLTGVDLEDAASRYARGCPRCGQIPCDCRRGPARS
jgi:NTP pyrophosphatase (non-canonical NTP hydrolase)